MPFRKKHITELKSLLRKNEPNRTEINQVIDLYQSRHIGRFDTAELLIRDLQARGRVRVEKAKNRVESYRQGEPVVGRQAREIENNSIRFEKAYVTRSLGHKVLRVDVRASHLGSKAVLDQTRVIMEAKNEAMKHIDPTKNYSFYITLSVPTDDGIKHISSNSKSEKNEMNTRMREIELLSKVNQFANKMGMLFQSWQTAHNKDITWSFSFVEMPSGGAHITSREVEEIYKKKSVVRIKNTDNSCFWRALSCIMFDDKHVKEGRPKQTKMASYLCNQCQMPFDEKVSLESIPEIEEKLNISIFVLDIENLPILNKTTNILKSLMYKGSLNSLNKKCWLLFNNDHFDAITNIQGFVAAKHFCEKCCSCYLNKEEFITHECNSPAEAGAGFIPRKVKIIKDNKKTMTKDLAHYLRRDICKGSKEEIKYKLSITKKKEEAIMREINNPRIISYDFETYQDEKNDNRHVPNLCRAQIIEVSDDHSVEKSFIGDQKVFQGESCLKDFCDWLMLPENANSTVIAHNQAGYDGKFILSWFIKNCDVPDKYIQQGSRISYMYYRKNNIRFIDSLSFFLCPLSKLSETFNIDTVKGYFPHKFNIPENQNYIGKIPDETYYGSNNMKPEDKVKFDKWYSENKEITNWNFQEEFNKYCSADVDLLSKSILKFRQIFKDKLDVDPFRYITLASLCKDIYLNKFLPEKTIVGNANKNQSIESDEWLAYLNDKNLIPEKPLKVFNENFEDHLYFKKMHHTFHVDAMDEKKKLVKEYNGCYVHGCPKCHPERKEAYERTMARQKMIEDNGYFVDTMWSCQWKEIKKILPNKEEVERQARKQRMNIRDALFGGRTEAFKTYVKCNKHQKIFSYDVVSLYPSVNALDDYAVGFKKYVNITVEDISSGRFFGLVKVDVKPPKGLYVPLLPESKDGKLMFHLNEMKEKTFSSIELKRALELGYEITKIHGALQYEKYNGLMKEYVANFIQMKIENSGIKTQEECDEINTYHKNLGFNFEIKPENCVKNAGMRMIAKICLNSLWGKFGQNPSLESYEFIDSYNTLLRRMLDPKLDTKDIHIINDNCVEYRYVENNEMTAPPEFISEITAVFTTANARLRLYDLISWIHPSQLLYCDTDSCYFLYDETNPLHKYPSNDAEDLPKSVQFGDGLGQWEYDLKKDEWIEEMIIGGAKSYAYKTNKGKIEMRLKGITLDHANSLKISYEAFKKTILEKTSIESESRYQFKWDSKEKQINTIYTSRTVQSTIDSKRVINNEYDTLPIGY